MLSDIATVCAATLVFLRYDTCIYKRVYKYVYIHTKISIYMCANAERHGFSLRSDSSIPSVRYIYT